MQRALWAGFISSAEKFPEQPAVFADGERISYQNLRERSSRIAATLQQYPDYSGPNLTAVFAYRTGTAFAGVLGSLLAGHGYVPLNRTFPIERTQAMFERSECRSLIVDAASLPQLDTLLQNLRQPTLVLLPELGDVEVMRQRWPNHRFLGQSDLAPAHAWRAQPVAPDAIAYLLFTSGSTGAPKGVAVTQRNVLHFVDYMVDRYEVTQNHRFSQMFDMTFDLSAFDMFVSWERGAQLCCPSQKSLINPGKFITDMELTHWFSVPSTASFMKQLGTLKPGRYPSLRFSLFCGEPLPASSAAAWLQAAPNSIVENLYGPTELTIACTLYRWDPLRSEAESEMGIVPIGFPYPGMVVLVADENLHEVGAGMEGELLMSGPQLSLGYWKDPEKTKTAFVVPPGRKEIYYRTGDRVRRPAGDGPLTHLGRIDFQVKVLGHRVELGEVESIVRQISGLDGVVAVGWPPTSSGFGGVGVFIEGAGVAVEKLRNDIATHLPEYMVPRRIHVMERLPRNANDKFDRKAMSKILRDQT